jgi:hypothetical protein
MGDLRKEWGGMSVSVAILNHRCIPSTNSHVRALLVFTRTSPISLCGQPAKSLHPGLKSSLLDLPSYRRNSALTHEFFVNDSAPSFHL